MTQFLDKVYAARTSDETRALYDDWAASYDDEVAANGYATPGRCAAALAGQIGDLTQPILDFGCGTGLSGLALKLAGFEVIDGMDLSADMLSGAAEKGVYRDLSQIGGDSALPNAPGDYAAIAAIGVIGAGGAPVTVMDRLLEGLAPGGQMVFSFNDHALADPVHLDKLNGVLGAGTARLLFEEYGDHLPGLGMRSRIYVLEKA